MKRPSIEELDYSQTPLGELILRRRVVRSLGDKEIFEVKMDGQFLMSSLTNSAEIALADIAMDMLNESECDVLVGGLGLGYTAKAALDTSNVRSVTVIEFLPAIIQWHERHLVPLGAVLGEDSRCRIVQDDFFRYIQMGNAAPPEPRESMADAILPERYHAILLDIDHSPQSLLHANHAAFYTANGLSRLRERLAPGGVFALWSAEAPDASFLDNLRTALMTVTVHESRFFNPLLNEEDVNYIVTGIGDGPANSTIA